MNPINLEDYAGSKEFPVVDAREYEFVLRLTKKTTKDGGKDFLNLDFFIRDDVDQPFQGSHVFDKAWRDTTNSQWFDLKKLSNILVTQKGREDYRTNFEECDEFVQYINGVCLRATVEKKFDPYVGEEVNSIKYLSYKPSNAGPYVKPTKEDAANTAPTPEQAPAPASMANPNPATAVGIEPPLQDVPEAEVEIPAGLKNDLPF